MDIKEKFAYTQSVDAVFKFFGDKAAIEKKQAKLGARNVNIETCKSTKDSLELKFSKESPLDAPSALKKFLGEWQAATQEESWTGSAAKGYKGTLKIDLKGVPVKMSGTYSLVAEGSGSMLEVTMSITCGIPLIGGKLADFIGKTAKEEMQKEYDYNKSALK